LLEFHLNTSKILGKESMRMDIGQFDTFRCFNPQLYITVPFKIFVVGSISKLECFEKKIRLGLRIGLRLGLGLRLGFRLGLRLGLRYNPRHTSIYPLLYFACRYS
jgi:hypothetical protein